MGNVLSPFRNGAVDPVSIKDTNAVMEQKNPLQDIEKLPFGLRVRAARIAAGLSQAELGDRLGMTKATVSKIENSAIAPSLERAEQIAAALNVSNAELVGWASGSRLNAVELVPVIGMIAAGNWREAIQTPEEHIPVAGAKPHMFALRVFGDSIDKIAPDGSYVTIDPTLPALEDGGMYAVQNGDGEATIKRFRRNPDRLEPESSNAEHRSIELGHEPITIIGRATSVVRTL